MSVSFSSLRSFPDLAFARSSGCLRRAWIPLTLVLALSGCSNGRGSAGSSGGPPPLALSITVDSPSLDLIDTAPAAQPVHVSRGGSVGGVEVVVDGLPPGVSAPTIMLPPGVADGMVVLQAAENAMQGSTKVVVHASAMGVAIDAQAPFEITLRGKPGTPDLSFGSSGVVTLVSAEAHALAVDSNGRIVIAGDDVKQSVLIARFLETGEVDPQFHGGQPQIFDVPNGVIPNADSVANAVAITQDDKIVISGRTRPFGTTVQNSALVARWDADGTRDQTFGPMLNGYVVHQIANENGAAASIAILPNGDLALGGWTYADPVTECGAYVHMDANGGLLNESAACPPAGETMAFGAIGAEPDAMHVLVFGHVDSSAGIPHFLIARYATASTTFDASYANQPIPFGEGDFAFAGAVFQDGSAVAAGMTSISGLATVAVARVDPFGQPVATFQSSGKAVLDTGAADGVAIDQNGGLILACTGTAGPLFSTLYRLDGNTGLIDLNFGTNGIATLSDSGAHVAAIALDTRGRILVGGTTSLGGNVTAFVERLWP